jgi:hypothetical protein
VCYPTEGYIINTKFLKLTSLDEPIAHVLTSGLQLKSLGHCCVMNRAMRKIDPKLTVRALGEDAVVYFIPNATTTEDRLVNCLKRTGYLHVMAMGDATERMDSVLHLFLLF